jgi:hypothetical protein
MQKQIKTRNYEYYLNGVQKPLKDIIKILNIKATTLTDKVDGAFSYTAIINGYTFKAVRINKNDK